MFDITIKCDSAETRDMIAGRLQGVIGIPLDGAGAEFRDVFGWVDVVYMSNEAYVAEAKVE